MSDLPPGPLRVVLLVLAGLARSRRDTARLSEELGIPTYDVKDAIDIAASLGLIDVGRRRLTDDGWRELDAARARRHAPGSFQENKRLYYPHSLRGGQ